MSAQIRIADTAEIAASDCSRIYCGHLDGRFDGLETAPRWRFRAEALRSCFSQKWPRQSFDWSRNHIFWVDERCVPPTDSQSNFKLADDTLFQAAKIPLLNVHRVYGELPPEEGAARYIAEIKSFFMLGEGQLPAFDVLHRGMGPDAHTASLFPGEPLIADRTGIAAHVWVEKMKMDRVTLCQEYCWRRRIQCCRFQATKKPMHCGRF